MSGNDRTFLHAVRDPKDVTKWCLVTSDEADAVTINARIIALGLNLENAEIIARAVNSRESMIGALEVLLDCIVPDNPNAHPSETTFRIQGAIGSAIDDARAALAQAERNPA